MRTPQRFSWRATAVPLSILLALSPFLGAGAQEQQGWGLDDTFGSHGATTTDVGPGLDFANDVVVQADGKIVVAGYATGDRRKDFALVRYNTDGSLDTGFGKGGIVTLDFFGGGLDDEINAVAISPAGPRAGQIAAVGSAQSPDGIPVMAVAIFDAKGSDLIRRIVTFGVTDRKFDQAYAQDAAFRSDGSLVVGGRVRLFDTGKNAAALVVFNPNLEFDTTFSEDGKALFTTEDSENQVNAVAVYPPGGEHGNEIVAVGQTTVSETTGHMYIARVLPNGRLDLTFFDEGQQTRPMGEGSSSADGVVVQPDGKIVVAGSLVRSGTSADFVALRLKTDGALDPDFATAGTGFEVIDFNRSIDAAGDIVRQADGKLVLTGRVTQDGSGVAGLARL